MAGMLARAAGYWRDREPPRAGRGTVSSKAEAGTARGGRLRAGAARTPGACTWTAGRPVHSPELGRRFRDRRGTVLRTVKVVSHIVVQIILIHVVLRIFFGSKPPSIFFTCGLCRRALWSVGSL